VIDDVAGELAAHSPRRVLEELAQLGRALIAAGRPRPEVELILGGGRELRGRIVAVGEGGAAGAVAVLMVGGTPRAPAIAYVRVDDIAALTVPDAALLLRGPAVSAPAPSRLELGRQAQAQAEGLSGALGRPIAVRVPGELDDDGRRAVAALIPLVGEVIGRIAADALGKTALAAIEAVELGTAGAPELWIEPPGTLVVRMSPLVGEPFTAATLRAALEKLL
jgi:hypothetical protein